MIEDIERSDANIRSNRYFIASAMARCPLCGASTAVHAIGVPEGYEVWVPADEGEDAGAWLFAPQGAFLFFVEYLPPAMCGRLAQLSNSYRPGDGGEDVAVHWVNHCGACDAPFDDNELFCEPEGAFLPISAAGAANVRVRWIEARITAIVGGCAEMPQFLDAMSRG